MSSSEKRKRTEKPLTESIPSSRKKKTKVTETSESEATTIKSLPYDVLLDCITRLPPLYYPTVSRVFNWCPPLVELCKYRSRLKRTESCLCVLLQNPKETRWFTLCLKPDRDEQILFPIADSFVEEELHLLSAQQTSLFYDPKKNEWGLVERYMVDEWRLRRHQRYVLVGNAFYRYDDNGIFICFDNDTKPKSWKSVKGLPNFSYYYRGDFEMVNYGGKLAVISQQGSDIRCAVIAFERRDGDEIWGKVDHFFTLPAISCYLLKALTVTL